MPNSKRHSWNRQPNAEHTKVCTKCGLLRLNRQNPRDLSWETDWRLPSGKVITNTGIVPIPCNPKENRDDEQGQHALLP